MHPVILRPGDITPNTIPAFAGLVLTHTVTDPRTGRRAFRKGQSLIADDLPMMASLLVALDTPIHAVRLDPGDVLEDTAAQRLATALTGDGVAQRKPVQSRVNLEATRKGLLRVDAEAIFTINRHAGIGVFTAVDRLPVLPGKVVAGAKIAPVAIPGQALADIETYLSQRHHPAIQVKPFLLHRAGVIVTEGLDPRVRDRFEETVRRKLVWYGSEVLRFAHVPSDPAAVTNAAQDLLADGATLLLSAGGNMMDPLDATIQALPEFDAEIVRLGAPAHPGSMFWLGYTAQNIPVVNLASCSMYSKSTVADLVLPWVMAGERIENDDLAALGYGGLLDRTTSWRFPPYEAEIANEPDENE
ncbi:MAG: hypothetical protein QM589_17100 [Thermomicrobiales bacterium]